jgi:hypothetical protein
MASLAKGAFVLNAVFLTLHEMDAVYWKEWRLFGIRDDELGRSIFLSAHVPIFLLIFAALIHVDRRFGRIISLILGSFLIVHFFLHLGAYSQGWFNQPLSAGIIAAMLLISVVQVVSTLFASSK